MCASLQGYVGGVMADDEDDEVRPMLQDLISFVPCSSSATPPFHCGRGRR